MVRLTTVLGVVALGGLALVLRPNHPSPAAGANVLQILTGFSAKESCSCVFVVQQTDDYCNAFGQQASSGFTVNLTFDKTAKTVTAQYLNYTRVAHFDGQGCVLDGL